MNYYIFERGDNNNILPEKFLHGKNRKKNNKAKQATQKICMEQAELFLHNLMYLEKYYLTPPSPSVKNITVHP